MAVSYKTKFATKAVQTELDLGLCDESGKEACGKGSFDPTEMENMDILRTKQNQNFLRFFLCWKQSIWWGYFLPKDLSVFQTGVSSSDGHQCSQGSPVRLHLPCEERLENWSLFSLGEEAALGGDEGPGGPPVHVWWSPRRQTQTLHSGAWWEDKRQQAKTEKGGIQTGCKGRHFHHCPERLWCLHLCMFSRVDWLKPRATWCGSIADPASGRTLDQRSPGVPSNQNCPTILWKIQSNSEIKISKYVIFLKAGF